MSGHPGEAGHPRIRPTQRVGGLYGLFLPLRAVTPCLFWRDASLVHPEVGGLCPAKPSPVLESSTALQNRPQQTSRHAIPTTQKSEDTKTGSLQRWGAQPGQRDEGHQGGGGDDTHQWGPSAESQALTLLSNSPSSTLPWLLNPDKPCCLPLTTLQIAFVSSKARGRENHSP